LPVWAGRRVIPLLLPALALAGLPLTSGAVAKAALKESAALLPVNWPLETLLGLAAVGTTLLVARFLWLIWRSEPPAERPPRLMWGSWAVLLALTAVTLFALPLAETAVADSLKLEKLWPSLWPILLGAGLAGAAVRFFPRSVSLPLIPPGDLVAPLGWLSGRLVDYFCQLEQLLVAGEYRLWGLFLRVAAFWRPFSGWLAQAELRLRHELYIVGGILLVMALAIMATIFL
jgi:hypothetical protein